MVQDSDFEGPPLTDGMVVAAERELGVSLPEAYVDLIGERGSLGAVWIDVDSDEDVQLAADFASFLAELRRGRCTCCEYQ